MRIKLADEDRKRLGVDEEWLHFDVSKITMREAELLQQAGFDSPADWRRGLSGQKVYVDGRVVLEKDEDGADLLDNNGLPVPKRRVEYRAVRALVWLCLRRNGHVSDWDAADYNLLGWDWESDEGKEDQPDPGESPSPSPS